jgi:hypothetical protein
VILKDEQLSPHTIATMTPALLLATWLAPSDVTHTVSHEVPGRLPSPCPSSYSPASLCLNGPLPQRAR